MKKNFLANFHGFGNKYWCAIFLGMNQLIANFNGHVLILAWQKLKPSQPSRLEISRVYL